MEGMTMEQVFWSSGNSLSINGIEYAKVAPMDQSRVLDDVRQILSQKMNVYRVGRDWGFANAGIMSDGYWTKEIAEIAARDAIIEAARAVAHVG